MFKKGQLIQSETTGMYYMVGDVKYPEQEYARVSPISNPACSIMTSKKCMRLIGNNYQAKPKCSR